MTAPSQAQIDEAKRLHGARVWTWTIGPHTLLHRAAKLDEIAEFYTEVADDKSKLFSQNLVLVRRCVLYPSPTEQADLLEAIFNEYPGVIMMLAADLHQIANGKAAERSKKAESSTSAPSTTSASPQPS